MPHGKLTVIVERAFDIEDPSKHGRGDSYCTLQCGNQALSTEVAEGAGSHPTFTTKFNFEIDSSANELVISVYSVGSSGDVDKLVGYTTLDFNIVFFHGHAVPLTAYPLSQLSGRAGGHISVSLRFKARPPPSAHNPQGPLRQHSAPLPTYPRARNQHQYNENDYEDEDDSSESSESSRSNGQRAEDQEYSPHFRRSQSEPVPLYEDHGADAFEYSAPGASNFQHHHRPRHPAPAQPRYNHATPAAHQARPNEPHGAVPVKRRNPGLVQSVPGQQRMQGTQYRPAVAMQGMPGTQHRPRQQGLPGTQYRPQQGMQCRPPQGMPGTQCRPRQQGMQGTQYRPQQGVQGRPRQGVPGMQSRPRQQGMQGTQSRPQQGVQGRPRQGVQRPQQQPGLVAQAAGGVAQAVVAEVARQSVQAITGGLGDMLGGLFGGD